LPPTGSNSYIATVARSCSIAGAEDDDFQAVAAVDFGERGGKLRTVEGQAFAQAIRRGPALADPQRWVTKVAFKIAAGELQDRRRHDYPLAERAYDMPEPTRDLVAALAQLSPKQRAAAVLHFRDGYTLAEVASLIGSTASAVGVHLYRARSRLADLLEGTDD